MPVCGIPLFYFMRGAEFSKRGARVPRSMPVYLLYLAHFLVELALGAVKLRGSYAGIDISCAPGAEKFARHHGVSLIALACLGGEVLRREAFDSEVADVVSSVLALFHAGTMFVMLHALNWKVVAIHLPFALGFLAHVLSRQRALKKENKRS